MTSRRSWWGARDARPTAGQATVELACILPLIAILLLVLLQGVLVIRDQVLTVNAAREAAREASVSADDGRIEAAAERVLDDVGVEIGARGRVGEGSVTVRVEFESKTEVPLIGALLPDVDLEATSTMRVER